MIRILVADDHALIREGLVRILSGEPGMDICCEATDGVQVLAQLRLHNPDVLLLDLSMPGVSGFDLIKRVHAEYPLLPILVLTMHDEQHYALRAIRAGAAGFLTKESANIQLINAIRKVAEGRPYITSAVAEQLAFDAMSPGSGPLHDDLSNREMQVLQKLVAGSSVSEIANELNLSVKTISTHKARILGKLRLASLADLVRYSMEHRLVTEGVTRAGRHAPQRGGLP